jgi:hypothetical protein
MFYHICFATAPEMAFEEGMIDIHVIRWKYLLANRTVSPYLLYAYVDHFSVPPYSISLPNYRV